jgi:3-oxoacyl-[acyl-carrier protein] reductase
MARELEQTGAQGFALDLSDMRAIDVFVAGFKKKTEQLDILIHNAAAFANSLMEQMTEKQWDNVLRVNLKAPFYLTQKLLPLLMRGLGSRRAGLNLPYELKGTPAKVFMLVSRTGLTGLAGASNYAASKGGLIAMTKTLAKELGRKKILVNGVNPGFMRSPMTESLSEKTLQRNLEESPLKTYSDPEEVADFLIYLSSDRMRQVTGQVFHFESRPF